MKEMDLYYRALRHYRKTVTADKAHMRFLQAISKAPAKDDKLECIRTKCIIDEEWVAAIEKYLPFVEKAIREDRQFIRQEGETVPIEKVKKVSKASVAHLARHSDLITHLPENESDPLIPDKIYMTENESNYAVYENRFLYMLLRYTRDFVELRYTKISELGNTYRGNVCVKKHVEIGKRTITFDATLTEVAKNDPRFTEDKTMHDMIERIEAIRTQISVLLMTPLMNELSKTPLLRPPVTRTNVLRMDNNFKNAVELYDYLSVYEGDGYTIEEIKKGYSPFTERMGSEIFEVIPLLTHLLYKYGNDIEDELKAAYNRAEAEEALAEAQRKAEELEALRRRIHESGESTENYLLHMEEYAKDLKKNIDKLHSNTQKLQASLDRVNEELKWQKDLEKQLRQGVEDLRENNNGLQTTLENERSEHKKAVKEAAEAQEKAFREMRCECEHKVAKAESDCRERITEMEALHKRTAQELQKNVSALSNELRKKEDEHTVLSARLHAYQRKNGEKIITDLTDKDNFAALEKEREWFERMFRETWSKTKRRIRREMLWQRRGSKVEAVEENLNEDKTKPSQPLDNTMPDDAINLNENAIKASATPSESNAEEKATQETAEANATDAASNDQQ